LFVNILQNVATFFRNFGKKLKTFFWRRPAATPTRVAMRARGRLDGAQRPAGRNIGFPGLACRPTTGAKIGVWNEAGTSLVRDFFNIIFYDFQK
jgi:hypothetical protein